MVLGFVLGGLGFEWAFDVFMIVGTLGFRASGFWR